MTHDLRTPLLAEGRALELFDSFKDQLNEDMVDIVNIMVQNNQDLLTMVNTMLETYQYEDGRIVLHEEPIQLTNIIQDCFTGLATLAEPRNIKLDYTVSLDVSEFIADPMQIRRVLNNLVGNAIANIVLLC